MNPKTRKILVLSLTTTALCITLFCIYSFNPSPNPKTQKILRSNDLVTLTGVDYHLPFFGPPNFGENPESDAKLIAHILRLNHPVDYIDEYGKTLHIDEVQLVSFGNPSNQEIACKGYLYDAHTGYHQRQVLLFHEKPFLEKGLDKFKENLP